MLILSRRPGEVLEIGEGDNTILVVVKSVSGNRVQLGVVAPPEVRVMRQEVLEEERGRAA